jgi:hypothetical protein
MLTFSLVFLSFNLPDLPILKEILESSGVLNSKWKVSQLNQMF